MVDPHEYVGIDSCCRRVSRKRLQSYVWRPVRKVWEECGMDTDAEWTLADADEDTEIVSEMLARPLEPPRAPREPRTECKLTLEEISRLEHYDVPSDDPGAPPTRSTRRVHEQVARVKATVNWSTEWIKPTLEWEFKRPAESSARRAPTFRAQVPPGQGQERRF